MELRRELILPANDTEYLNNAFPNWESIVEGNWVLLPNFPLPDGYTCSATTAAIKIASGYPVTQLDMVYFYPAVFRRDGAQIPATNAIQFIDSNEYQRWSRHYRPGEWRPDEDCIATHVMAIKSWLELAAGDLRR